MMKFLHIALLACVLLSAGISVTASEDPDVLVLTDDTFADAIANNDNIMVEFYAPWCGHCKKLVPEYAQVATELKGTVPVAKVDCTTEKETCNGNGVKGFPTLKLFQKGKALDYQQERTAPAMTAWLRKQTGPAATTLVAKNIDLFLSMDTVSVIGYFESATSDKAQIFTELANELRTEHQFGITTDAAVKAKYSATGEGVIVVAKFNDAPVAYSGEFTVEELSKFVKSESFPVVGEIGPENYQKYVERKLPLFWFFVSAADFPTSPAELTAPLAEVKTAAANFKGQISAVYLDGEKYVRHRNQLGHSGALPGGLLEDAENHKKYLLGDDVSAAAIQTFLQSFVDGSLEPFLKSEEIPTPEQEAASPVKTVVGKNFEDVVFDDSKNVFVEFYAPWCGHCKNLAPTYESLAQKFSAVEDLVIAKVDATANDVPAQVQGFPTLIMYPKGAKNAPVKYEGDRSFDDLKSFLNKYV
jgi:protein disulfide-isomerase A1